MKNSPPSQRVQDLVIGGGVIGVACAHALADAGRSVVILEKGDICSGCSQGNAGLISASHTMPIPVPGLVKQSLKWMLKGDSPLYIKPTLRPSMLAWMWRFFRSCNHDAALRGRDALAALHQQVVTTTQAIVERYGLDCELSQRGLLNAFISEQKFAAGREEAELLNEVGIETQTLDRDEVHRREPVLDPAVCGGIFYPADADVIPDRFVMELAKHLPGMGVKFVTDTTVEGFERGGSGGSAGKVTRVKTSGDDFEPENVILAAGAWSTRLARILGVHICLEPAKGYNITFPAQAGLPSVPTLMADVKIGSTPWKNTVRLAGTMELAGLQRKINPVRVEALVRGAQRFLPHFEAKDRISVWTGMRPLSSDALPIIGKTRAAANLYFATGHAMLGLTQAVVTGKLIAELVTGQTPSVPLEPFSPDRF